LFVCVIQFYDTAWLDELGKLSHSKSSLFSEDHDFVSNTLSTYVDGTEFNSGPVDG